VTMNLDAFNEGKKSALEGRPANQNPYAFFKSPFYTRSYEQQESATNQYAESGWRVKMDSWHEGWRRAHNGLLNKG